MIDVSVRGFRISRREIFGALAAAVLINLIGALGVPFTTPDSAWFQALDKPWFYPPNATFGTSGPCSFRSWGSPSIWSTGKGLRIVR